MANTKNSQIRQMVIDRCLRSDKLHSTQDMMDECNEELLKRKEPEVTSRTTILEDITNIENTWHALIEKIKKGRNIYYRYADRNFSIYKSQLSVNDISKLKETLEFLSKFKGIPNFEWIDEMSVRMNSIIGQENLNSKFVSFDENLDYIGIEYFTPLFNHIANRNVLDIEYKDFKQDKPTSMTIHPYYLKQYNKRWFLLGLNEQIQDLTILALDRITSLNISNIKYKEPGIDFDDYFYDIIGVTRYKNKEPQTIKMFVSSKSLQYIKTKPLHASQKIKCETEKGAIVEIKVIPNKETEQLILSFSDAVQILEPTEYQQYIKSKLQSALEKYGNVQLE